MAKQNFFGSLLSALIRKDSQINPNAQTPQDNRELQIKEFREKPENKFKIQYENLHKYIEEIQDYFSAPKDFEVGFIGRSQVGKSTLINSLLADALYPRILPSGGIGPLTAISISIRYGEKRRLEVEYQKIENLKEMIAEIENLQEQIENAKESSREDKANLKKYLSELSSLITGQQNAARTSEYLIQTAKALSSSETTLDSLKNLSYLVAGAKFRPKSSMF